MKILNNYTFERIIQFTPEQKDGVNCGVFVIKMVRSICQNMSERNHYFEENEETMKYYRLQLLWEILHNKFSKINIVGKGNISQS